MELMAGIKALEFLDNYKKISLNTDSFILNSFLLTLGY